MRLQAHLTPENAVTINRLLADVNTARKAAGMEPATISLLHNEIIDRIAQMPVVYLCGVCVAGNAQQGGASCKSL